jgi:hypothetical protein
MLLNDLLDSVAVDAGGAELGRVVDVRLEISGAPGQLLAGTKLTGLLVSPHSRLSTWGFERRGQMAPAIIARPQHWLHRGLFLVAWEDVARIDRDRIELRDGATRLDPMLPDAPRSR